MTFPKSIMPIKTNAYLYLSGTPFRAIISGEFIEEQMKSSGDLNAIANSLVKEARNRGSRDDITVLIRKQQ